jgi:predicted RNase H-like nuclease
MPVAGVDVWRGRWIAVVVNRGRYQGALVSRSIEELLGELAGMTAIGIDMPIGLIVGRAPREADGAARRFVGPHRGSSVFPTYPREIYEASDYTSARIKAVEHTERSVSRQAYAMRDRLLELDAALPKHPNVFEVHPEVSFCAMAGRHLVSSKKAWNGFHERSGLLTQQGLVLPTAIPDAGEAGAEDLLDAAAAAWSAERIGARTASSLPNPPQVAAGRQIAIWY